MLLLLLVYFIFIFYFSPKEFQEKRTNEEVEEEEEKELYDLLSDASQQTLIVNSLDYFKQSINKNDLKEPHELVVVNGENEAQPQLDESEVYKRVWSMKHIVKHTDFNDYSLFVKHDCVNSFQRLLEHSLDELAHVDFDRVEIEYEFKRKDVKLSTGR